MNKLLKAIITINISFFFFFNNITQLFSLETLVLNNENNIYKICPFLDYYEDKSSTLTIDEILKKTLSDDFIENKKNFLNFHYTKSTIWLRFKIKNNSNDNSSYIIESLYPFISSLELYSVDGNDNFKIQKNGLKIPFNQREIKNKKTIFNIKINFLEEKEFYLKIKSTHVNFINLNLYSENYFYYKDNKENFLQGMYYGIMLIILIINIIIFLFIREISYFYFILFYINVVIIQAFYNNVIIGIFPNSIWYSYNIFFPFACVGLLFALLFTNIFFNTKKNYPKFHIILFLLKIAMIIDLILTFFIFKNLILILLMIPITFIILTFISIGTISLLKRFRPGIYFLLAWGFYFFNALILVYSSFLYLPENLYTIYNLQIGSIFLAIFLPISLLDKYNILKKDKILAEKTIAEKERDKFASIGMLLGGITHEIYNPLSGISGPLDNIKKILNKKDKLDLTKLNKYIDYINTNTHRIDDIIKNIRALYKNPELKKEKIKIKDTAKSVIDYYKSNVIKKIDFLIDIDDNIEITGDNNALYQILNNLISNAVDSIKDQGIIKILFKKNNNKKIIKVTDTGTGIRQENINKIFNAFYTTKSTNGKHMGLGLYIVKDLISKLGWKIEVESKDEKETNFIILIKE